MKDIMGLMKQAQGLQQKMADMQSELEALSVEGVAGGGVVKVVSSVKGQIRSVSIDSSLMVPDDKEILEDLLVAALNDAKSRADRITQERMQEMTKGLPIPPGLNLF